MVTFVQFSEVTTPITKHWGISKAGSPSEETQGARGEMAQRKEARWGRGKSLYKSESRAVSLSC